MGSPALDVWSTATFEDVARISNLVTHDGRPQSLRPHSERERALFDGLKEAVASSSYCAPEHLREYLVRSDKVPNRIHPLNRAFVLCAESVLAGMSNG